MTIKRHFTHIKSKEVNGGAAKLPQAENLFFGEIAVNYAKGYETLAIKNNEEEIITFSSDNVIAKSYSSATQISEALSAHTQPSNTITSLSGYSIASSVTSITTADTLNSAIGKLEKGVDDAISMVDITYSALKSLRDNSKLVKGKRYKITDYVATSVQENTQPLQHRFDVIVLATDVNKLNENALAVQHLGDTYFSNSNLDAWELKYCLDNDTHRFAWADNTQGKGVIYYMKDEWGNECPYDFKNIQFKIGANSTVGTVADVYYYTFSVATGSYDSNVSDHSLNGEYCNGNKIGEVKIAGNKLALNHIMFRNTSNNTNCSLNVFGLSCKNNLFGNGCSNNVFSNNCINNVFGNYCESNTFGNSCQNIIFSKGYTNYVIVDDGNTYIELTSTATVDTQNKLRNITIAQGVNNTSTLKTISHNTTNDIFRTTYQPINTNVIVV